jgi:hypothetical protein
MSEETIQELTRIAAGFDDRVWRSNKKLAGKMRRQIHSTTKKNREAYGEPSDNFRFTFYPDAHPELTSAACADLYAFGVGGEALAFPEADGGHHDPS